ncbi:MAG TPA: hypothetical protein DCG12_23455 [Planctomycetaceae bacterium]|nr:hypothetical protein [Planctomycetaceae bacterium]
MFPRRTDDCSYAGTVRDVDYLQHQTNLAQKSGPATEKAEDRIKPAFKNAEFACSAGFTCPAPVNLS